MKFFILIVVLISFVSGCSKYKKIYNKEKPKFFTSSVETKSGGRISSHVWFGESSNTLINIATLRCKKISSKSKIKNFRKIFHGNIVTNQMNVYKYDCKED